MQNSHSLSSSSVFIFVGLILIFVAFVTLPTKVMIYAQPADADDYNIGWLFSPVIGVWGLAVVALGLVQSSMPKRKTESYLLFLTALVGIGLAYVAYLLFFFGSGVIASAGRGEPLFWLYFALVLGPSLVIFGFTAKYLNAQGKKLFLAGKNLKIAALLLSVGTPVTYTVVLLKLMNVF